MSFKPYLNQDFEQLKNKYLNSGRLFEDEQFPPNSSSIYRKKPVSFQVYWKRPKEIVNNPQFIVDGIDPNDLAQGKIGDCWFVSAASSISFVPEYSKRVIPVDQSFESNYAGIFHFRFWKFGEWIDVVVDDYLPTDAHGKLIYLSNRVQKNEFFAPLLEKAYAKLYGCYEFLDGGNPGDAMTDLTGSICEYFDLKKCRTEKPLPPLYSDNDQTFSQECSHGKKNNNFGVKKNNKKLNKKKKEKFPGWKFGNKYGNGFYEESFDYPSRNEYGNEYDDPYVYEQEFFKESPYKYDYEQENDHLKPYDQDPYDQDSYDQEPYDQDSYNQNFDDDEFDNNRVYTDPETLWKFIHKSTKMKSLMNAAFGNYDPENGEIYNENGLYSGHAYSVMQAVELTKRKIRILKLRNPWGLTQPWTGEWSLQSYSWQNLDTNTKLEYKLKLDNYGEFYISFNDFLKYFEDLVVSHLNMDAYFDPDEIFTYDHQDWTEDKFYGEWLSGKNSGPYNTWNNTQYFFKHMFNSTDTNDDEFSPVIASLMQPYDIQARFNSELDYYKGLKLEIFAVICDENTIEKKISMGKKFNQNELDKIDSTGPYVLGLREISRRGNVSYGSHVIIPSVDSSIDLRYLIRIFHDKNKIKALELKN